MELGSGKVTSIGKLDMTNEVSWSDENDLITGTPDGKIQLIGLDGKAKELSFQDPNRSELMSHVEKWVTPYFIQAVINKGIRC